MDADGELYRRYRLDRDEDALGAIVARHWPRVYRLAYRIVRDPALAEDAAQEAFVALVRERSFRGEASLSTWLLRITINTARNALRAQRRRLTREQRAAGAGGRGRGGGDRPESDLAVAVDEELARLPDDLRVPLVLRYVEGHTHDEVAAILGCPAGTASSRIRRGIERLREALGSGVAGFVPIEAIEVALRAPPHAVPAAPPPPSPAVLVARAAALGARALLVKVAATLVVAATAGGFIASYLSGPGSSGAGPALVAAGVEPQSSFGVRPALPPAPEPPAPAKGAEKRAPVALAPPAARGAPASASTPAAVPAHSEAIPDGTTAAAAEDPLVARMRALTAKTERLAKDLVAEVKERMAKLPPDAVDLSDLNASSFKLVGGAAEGMEHMPADPERMAEAYWAWERAQVEVSVVAHLRTIDRLQQRFREGLVASGQPGRYAVSLAELGIDESWSGGDGAQNPSHELRIAEASPDHFAVEAAPRPDFAGEPRPELWLRIDETGTVRADRVPTSARSPLYDEMRPEAEAPFTQGARGDPSRHAGRIAEVLGEVERLDGDLVAEIAALIPRAERPVPPAIANIPDRRPAPSAHDVIELDFESYLFLKTGARTARPRDRGGSKGSNEASVIASLRNITTAQALFREGDKDRNGVLDYARNLDELCTAGLIDMQLGLGDKRGYAFRILPAPERPESPAPERPRPEYHQFLWSVTADPIEPGVTGDRYFFVDESGVIRFSTTGTAGPESIAIGG